MNNKHPLLVLLTAASVLLVVVAEALAWFIIPTVVPATVRFSLPLLFLASMIVLFPAYKRLDSYFALDVSKAQGDDDLHAKLDNLGKAPIMTAVFYFPSNVILIIIACNLVMRAFGHLSVSTEVHVSITIEMVTFICFMIALCGLGEAAIYALSDRLVSRVLARARVAKYPLSLKANRQYLKFIILPTVTLALGIVIAIAAGLFGVAKGMTPEQRTGIHLNQLLAYVAPFGALYVIPILILVVTWARGTAKSYASVIGQLDGMISGESDLTKRIEVSSIDEIASIAARVNVFTESLHGMVKELGDSARVMETVVRTLQGNAASISSGVSTIARDIESLNFAAEEQGASVTETSSTITQIAGSIESLTNQIEDQSTAVAESSASVQEMVANVGAISENVANASGSFDELKGTADGGRESINNVQNLVNRLAAQSDSLLEANNVIDNIAAQTNLLAMNAAIEAAHAGEAGKGFAVVAQEIRKLAESSAAQSKAIATGLKATIDSIRNIAQATTTADSAFDTVASKIDAITGLVSEINHAMIEQASGSRQVLEALQDIEHVTVRTRDGAIEMNAGTESILKEVARLSGVSNAVQERSSSIAKAAEEISASIEEIVQNSGASKEAIDVLLGITGRFKV